MHSEEVVKLNVALRYCDQLKNNLQASILHVSMLNRKYNTTDYTVSLLGKSFISSPRVSCVPSPRPDTSTVSEQQPAMEPKAIRSINEIKQNFNNIIVNGIKLRREVETTDTQLKLLGNEQRKDSPYVVDKRRFQSPKRDTSQTSSPSSSGCRHGRCFQSSPDKSSGSSTTSLRRKVVRRSLHNHNNLEQPPATAKEIKFQSTPIKINESVHALDNSLAVNSGESFSQFSIADDSSGSCSSSVMNSSIKPCFRNALNSSAQSGMNDDSPKRICWTPVVKVRRFAIYQ